MSGLGFFFFRYKIDTGRDYDEVTRIFRDNLDDMSKKGYSMTKYVIENSDHKGKLFSGEYKNNHFVVRQTDSPTDDFYFRILPKHLISFESGNGRATINVKSSNSFMLLLFIVLMVIAVLTLSIILLLASMGEVRYIVSLFALIPTAIGTIVAMYSRHQLADTKITLEYIYKQR